MNVKLRNLESEVIGVGQGEPVDFVFDVPIHPW